MKKSITIIDYNQVSVEVYINQLQTTFEDKLKVKGVLVKEFTKDKIISSDLIVFSSYCLYLNLKKHIHTQSKTIIMDRTITKDSYIKLLEFKDFTESDKIYLIDETENMARDMCYVIRKLIKSDLEIIPCGVNSYEKIKSGIIISLGHELKNVKQRFLNIGISMMSIGSIIEIGIETGLVKMLSEKDILNVYKEMISYNKGLMYLINRTNRYKGRFESFFDYFEEGYFILDINGNVEDYNKKAIEILKLEFNDIEDFNILDLLTKEIYTKVFLEKKIVKDEIIQIEGSNIILSIYPTLNSGKFYGATIIIKEFSEIEKRQHEIRKKIIGKGHRAKYRFTDIIGESDSLKESIAKAKRMSLSNSSILIEGETGTGKELFAQAIHNYSHRKKYQFVAVNFGALPSNILESELFGYEEGAFTGAKKGGKPGLFELAHKGTIFLDEIGEMPINLQAKLLRVLQEKEVMRLGSDKIISIDIRVIAATNRNLYELVNDNEFRKDLFYRLKVLPLKISPLRYRKEDILVILEYYRKHFKGKFELSQEAKEMLMCYDWAGNIRELRNFVEYFNNTGKNVIGIEDLPIENSKPINSDAMNKGESSDYKKLIEIAGAEKDKYFFVLNVLYENYTQNIRMGRRSICNLAVEREFKITEQEVRRILNHLDKLSLVRKNIGRKGSEISNKGIEVLKKLIG